MKRKKITQPKQLIIALIGILFIGSISSCKKDEIASGPNPIVQKDLIVDVDWKYEAIIMDFMGAPTNIIDFMDDCQKDNLTTFTSDNRLVGKEGATKCDPNDPQEVIMGTWQYYSNKTQMIWMDGVESDTLDIISFSDSTLTVSMTEVDPTTQEIAKTTIQYKK